MTMLIVAVLALEICANASKLLLMWLDRKAQK
jgi:hypothetical protein